MPDNQYYSFQKNVTYLVLFIFKDKKILPVIIIAIKIKDHSIGILYKSISSIFIPTKTNTTARP